MQSTIRGNWLRDRQKGIGATDIASIAGVGFRSAADVYRDKVADEPNDTPGNPMMRMGLATEDLNAEIYADKSNIGDGFLLSPGLIRSTSIPWMFATLDRIAIPDNDPSRVVELKYVGPFFGEKWGDNGTDEIPEAYILQATWQAAIAIEFGREMAHPHVSALSGSGEHRIYTVHFSRRLADMLIELASIFWDRVKSRIPVGPDWAHPLQTSISDSLSKMIRGTQTLLGNDAQEIAEEIDRLAFIKALGDSASEDIRLLKRRLLQLLDSNEVGMLPDGRRVKRYDVPQSLISPKSYIREARSDLRILGKKTSTPSSKGTP